MPILILIVIGAAAGFLATRFMRVQTDVPTTIAIGIGGFGKGGEFNRKNSNKLMRLRVMLQASLWLPLQLYAAVATTIAVTFDAYVA